jgi:signal transduction histidine kinase
MIGVQSLRSLLPLVLGFLLLLITASAAAFLSIRRDDATRQVQQTLEIDGQLNRIQTLVTDAETGQRGFLLTGRLTYLDPYAAARRELGPALDRLAGETAANPVQQRAIAALRTEIATKLGELQETIDLRLANRPDAALAILNNDSGKETMARIRSLIADMREEERRLLEQRSARAAWLSEFGQWAVIGSALLVVVLGGLTLRDSRRRLMALQASNVQLAKEVGERRAAESQVLQLQKMEAVGQLTGGIAHDFNNMLAIIIGSLDLAARRLAKGDIKIEKYLASAQEGGRRAASLIQQLLAFSRQQPLAPAELDANKLVTGMSELLRRSLGETIRLETVLADELWKTHADRNQLENAMLNLVVNARDAMPDGGQLTVETANAVLDEAQAARSGLVPGEYLLIAIRDTGGGMSPEVIDKAFDPFFTTKQSGAGTGLGLSQVYGFVRQSGGHVAIESVVGKGTTVRIYLPRYVGGAAPKLAEDESSPMPTGDGSVTVLVVEDEDGVRAHAVAALRELGYKVFDAAGAADALKVVDAHPEIELLFTDVVMPEMNGRRLSDQVRQRRPDVRVLFTTGYTRDAIVHNGTIEAGVSLITKPFTLDQLARKVAEVLRA